MLIRRISPALLAILSMSHLPAQAQDWSQWGRNARHTSATNVVGQRANHILADVIYDPFNEAEKADPFAGGSLLAHYQVPLLNGDSVFMEFKSGSYTGIQNWNTQTWNEKKLVWNHSHLTERWTFKSDWKPVPFLSLDSGNGPFFEPVFHAALADQFIYIPGAGGSVFKVNKNNGALVKRFKPFGDTLDPNTYSVAPITVDGSGNVYYNVLKLDPENPWDVDVVNSWLVKISANGTMRTVTYTALTPGAPHGADTCLSIFHTADLPWPPSPDAVPGTVVCGSQRPPANAAPAVAPDGTIYVVSRAHFWELQTYLIAVRPNLTLKWVASLRDRFHDGCNVLLPANGQPNGCRTGAHTGVDPSQNRPGAGTVNDNSTSSPIVAPDGSVLFGASSRYNYAQGHLMKFSPGGEFLASYPFGWDITPAIFSHNGTYSLLLKDNQYSGLGSYCDDETLCPPDRTATNPGFPEGYFITRLNSDLQVEWRWQNTNTDSCVHDANGSVSCVSDHPDGFEWCVNGPAVDRAGNVYNNSEDGNVYVLRPDGSLRDRFFLDQALGAAYTPLSLDKEGRILAQNDGHLFVVGNGD